MPWSFDETGASGTKCLEKPVTAAIRPNADAKGVHATWATANVRGALSVLVNPSVGSAVHEMNSEKCPPPRVAGTIGLHSTQEGLSWSKRSS